MKRIFFCLSFLVVFGMYMQGQSKQQDTEITGRVVLLSQMSIRSGRNSARDIAYEQAIIDSPAIGAKIELVSQGETYSATTDLKGSFMIKDLRPDLVRIRISLPPLKPISGSFELLPGDNIVLASISVSPNNPPEIITQQGDTLTYRASYVSDLKGIEAMERLARFPGVEIENGTIIITGRGVHRTYLDGALILGIVD